MAHTPDNRPPDLLDPFRVDARLTGIEIRLESLENHARSSNEHLSQLVALERRRVRLEEQEAERLAQLEKEEAKRQADIEKEEATRRAEQNAHDRREAEKWSTFIRTVARQSVLPLLLGTGGMGAGAAGMRALYGPPDPPPAHADHDDGEETP